MSWDWSLSITRPTSGINRAGSMPARVSIKDSSISSAASSASLWACALTASSRCWSFRTSRFSYAVRASPSASFWYAPARGDTFLLFFFSIPSSSFLCFGFRHPAGTVAPQPLGAPPRGGEVSQNYSTMVPTIHYLYMCVKCDVGLCMGVVCCYVSYASIFCCFRIFSLVSDDGLPDLYI